MIFRVCYQTLDHLPHVYCALYVAPHPNETFALCGTFTVRTEEFEPMREAFAKVEFVREDPIPGYVYIHKRVDLPFRGRRDDAR